MSWLETVEILREPHTAFEHDERWQFGAGLATDRSPPLSAQPDADGPSVGATFAVDGNHGEGARWPG